MHRLLVPFLCMSVAFATACTEKTTTVEPLPCSPFTDGCGFAWSVGGFATDTPLYLGSSFVTLPDGKSAQFRRTEKNLWHADHNFRATIFVIRVVPIDHPDSSYVEAIGLLSNGFTPNDERKAELRNLFTVSSPHTERIDAVASYIQSHTEPSDYIATDREITSSVVRAPDEPTGQDNLWINEALTNMLGYMP